MENIEKKSGLKDAAYLILGILIFIGLFVFQTANQRNAAQIPNVNGGMSRLAINGVIAQLQVLVSTFMVVNVPKKGFYTASILNGLNCLFVALISLVIEKNPNAAPGVLIPLCTIVIITIIYLYAQKISKTNKELSSSNAQLTERNRVIQEKDKKLTFLAYYDVLTGLANRQLFIDKIDELINTAGNVPFTIIYTDIDNFKNINDTYGHNSGDSILSSFADRLKLVCGTSNFIARIGGNEFGVILQGNMSEGTILSFVDRMRTAISEPIIINGVPLRATMSYGITTYPQDARTSEELLKSADIAVLNAKYNGKDRPCFYNQQQHIHRQ